MKNIQQTKLDLSPSRCRRGIRAGRTALPARRISTLVAPGIFAALFACLLLPRVAAATVTNAAGLSFTTNSSYWVTNGPGVYELSVVTISNTLINPKVYERKIPLPLHLRPRIETNTAFHHLLAGSLNEAVWTNVIARTNGRTTQIWQQREHPPGWPEKPPLLRWNHNGLMWGMRGLTALCPCWSGEGAPGQVPVTALTRRHGYARGHSMGPDGIGKAHAGKKLWFLTREDKLVEVKVVRSAVRISSAGDYTILLFDRDLPTSIEPLRVLDYKQLSKRFSYEADIPHAILGTEQTGNVNANVPGFNVAIMKGGDSGSPNLLPLGNELLFVSGRSTSAASPAMQNDMDELCRLQRLDPKRYQLQWASVAAYPEFQSGQPTAR